MNDSYVLINLLITLLHTADRTEDEYATKHDQWWVSTRPNTADVHTLRTALNMFPSWYLVLQTLIVFLDADRLLITLLLAHCTAECRNKQGITAGEEQTHRRTDAQHYACTSMHPSHTYHSPLHSLHSYKHQYLKCSAPRIVAAA